MCLQSVRLRDGSVVTGRLVDHLGNGRAEVDCAGVRVTGEKVERRVAAVPPRAASQLARIGRRA